MSQEVLKQLGLKLEQVDLPYNPPFKRWGVFDTDSREVLTIDVTEEGSKKMGNLSWAARVSLDQAVSLSTLMRDLFSDKTATIIEGGSFLSLDSEQGYICMDIVPDSKEPDPGVNIGYFDLTPFGQLVEEIFFLTTKQDMSIANRKSLAAAVVSIASKLVS